MIRHLLKIVWHRKRSNGLIMIEILISFLVVFALLAASLYLYDNYGQPLGFDPAGVWSIEVSRNAGEESPDQVEADSAVLRQLLREAESLEPVIAAAGASTGPYYPSVSVTGWTLDEREVQSEVAWATDGLLETLGLRLVEGRWLEPADEALAWDPLVINLRLAREVFGDESPIGRPLRTPDDEGGRDWRVVGVIDDFKRGGELDAGGNFMFQRVDRSRLPQLLQVKLRPGTAADFEEALVDRLQAIVPSWSFRVIDMQDAREQYLRQRLSVLGIGALIAGFLLLMVVLGLTGVLWQNVTRRTREIGLRRATGATCRRVQRQIVAEVAITAGLGLSVGLFVALQVMFLGPFGFIPLRVTLGAAGLATGFMMVLSILCGLYPGWTATRVHPAAALHYE